MKVNLIFYFGKNKGVRNGLLFSFFNTTHLDFQFKTFNENLRSTLCEICNEIFIFNILHPLFFTHFSVEL